MTSSDDNKSSISFPRHSARTQRFSLGRPRSFTISPDGSRVVFVRSSGGSDRVGRLWSLDIESGTERSLVDPAHLLAGGTESLSAAERARRERARESAGGVVAYATDASVSKAVFALSGRLFVTDLSTGEHLALPSKTPAIDPRMDPTGQRVAYSHDGSLRMVTATGDDDRALVEPDGECVSWGQANFLAAEEFDRDRGFWWSPDGQQLLVERVDDSAVETWHVSDPTHPELASTPQRYPAAGRTNPDVTLWLLSIDGARQEVMWDRETFEYVTSVSWSSRGPLLIEVMDRRQRRAAVLAVDVESGATTVKATREDAHWVDVHHGVPTWGPDGELLTIASVADRYALIVDGTTVTPADMQVKDVLHVADDHVLFVASRHPTMEQVWRWANDELTQVTDEPGLFSAVKGGSTELIVHTDLTMPSPRYRLTSKWGTTTIRSSADVPSLIPNVTILPGDPDEVRVAVVMPQQWQPGQRPLPVLLDPYGGPHAQRVLSSQAAFRESQWFADQGFAVVVVDGRGTPGSPSWERGISSQWSTVVLDDQVRGLHAAAHTYPDLDLDRVAIRGWSFGGYLAALAVIDRPEIFKAAIAGAPVTDWQLYDSAYTERYLGTPQDNLAAYLEISLLKRASTLSRPLQIIHGFADDNVFVANSLQLSQVLTEHGRPHQVLPLSGITHMAAQEEVAEALMLLQVDFLHQALGMASLPMS